MESQMKTIMSGEDSYWWGSLARKMLYPLSCVYGAIARQRNRKYDSGNGVTTVAVPVISVGNITAGGTGKTPMVRYICDYLSKQGQKPAVLTRGYGAADNSHPLIVSQWGHIEVNNKASGDEAYLLAQSLPTSSVIIGRKRRDSAQVAMDTLGATVLVMDDGFQHRALGRNVDIVLIDAANPFGYGHVLPRGLLREPLEGLARATAFVLTKADQVRREALDDIREVLQQYAPHTPVFTTVHRPVALYASKTWPQQSLPIDYAVEKPVMLVSGIGNPQSFMLTVEAIGYDVNYHIAYGDHHDFTADDVTHMVVAAKDKGAQAIVTTEKDAVKLRDLWNGVDMPLYVLAIGIAFRDKEEEFTHLLQS